MAPTMSSDAPSFEKTGLPEDIWIEVVLQADPLDAMALSQTCMVLHTLLSQKPIWKAILREVMRKNGPFIVSYSLDDLTVDELQHAATRAERWRRFTTTTPSSTRNMDTTLEIAKVSRDCSVVVRRHTNGAFRYRFISGGRFLLMSGIRQDGEGPSQTSIAEMTLWDLGSHNPLPSVEPILVASYVITRGFFPPSRRLQLEVDVCVASETRLTVVALFTGMGEASQTMTVFSLSLESQERHFNVIRTIGYQSKLSGKPVINGHYVLFVMSPLFFLWNYVDSRMCVWQSPHSRGGVKDTFVNESYVVSILEDGVRAWDISQLGVHPHCEMNHPTVPAIEPHLFLPAPWLPTPRGAYAIPTKLQIVPSTTTNSSSILFDVATSYLYIPPGPFDKSLVFRYELTITKNTVAIEGALILKGAGHFPHNSFHILPWPSVGICRNPEEATNGVRLCSYCPVEPRLPHPTPTPEKDVVSATPVVLTPLDYGWPVASCALSGRVIYLRIPAGQPDEAGDLICADYIS